MTCLILGGTKDARDFADQFVAANIPVIYSIKGLVRTPDLPCKVIVGGFSQFGGLSNFIKDNLITSILDATHPYADKMTQAAVNASIHNQIPCWVFDRPAWQPEALDHWVDVNDWQDVADFLLANPSFQRVFLSAGQLPEAFLSRLSSELASIGFILRTAVKPKATLPQNIRWIKAIGPFNYQDELTLANASPYDLMVSKNSGGKSTYSKLVVARDKQIPVLMFKRPHLPNNAEIVAETSDIVGCVKGFYRTHPVDMN
ncbi:MAG: precorrin-6A/cobalt-precorrin-6A reductase [Cellvibrionales bacterium]|nr:precorrin-6A/cobalt-precorrin-6A reductase [Cellvibrionales bacterium]